MNFTIKDLEHFVLDFGAYGLKTDIDKDKRLAVLSNQYRYTFLLHGLKLLKQSNIDLLNNLKHDNRIIAVNNVLFLGQNVFDINNTGQNAGVMVVPSQNRSQTMIIYHVPNDYKVYIVRFDDSQQLEDMDIEVNILNHNVYKNKLLRIVDTDDTFKYVLINHAVVSMKP